MKYNGFPDQIEFSFDEEDQLQVPQAALSAAEPSTVPPAAEPVIADALDKQDDDQEAHPAQTEQPPPVEDQPPPDNVKKLQSAKDLLARARLVSDALFEAARDMPEYRRMIATTERYEQFERKLLDRAKAINTRLETNLTDNELVEVVEGVAKNIAHYQHDPDRQRERQKKQVARRRKKNRGRDLRIVRLAEDGVSQRAIAKELGATSRGAVENVLLRDAPHLLNRRKKHPRPRA